MTHFLRLAAGLDFLPLLLAIRQQPGLWGRSFRTTVPNGPHREMLDCILRCQIPERSEDPRECFWHPAWHALPQVRPLLFPLMTRVEGVRLGRVMLTLGVPGTQIYPHADIGPKGSGHYDTEPYWSRFHIVLEANEQCGFACGADEADEETVCMRPGEAWWFDAALTHRCWNAGPSDRVHLIMDIHTGQDV